MLEFHGFADGQIDYAGKIGRKDACLPAIPQWIQQWAERAELESTNASSQVPGALGGGTAARYQFGTGSEEGLVTHIMDGTVSYYPIPGQAHQQQTSIQQSLTTAYRLSDTTGHPRC